MENNKLFYLLTGLVGAVIGGIAVLTVTKAIPKMMAEMMPKMMENMMAQMAENGCNPAEM